jgi:hypothetical protein
MTSVDSSLPGHTRECGDRDEVGCVASYIDSNVQATYKVVLSDRL